MKKINTLILTIVAWLFTSESMAQVQKTMVVEHFTNTLCGFCSSRNPGFFSNVASQQNLIQISFHPSAPYSACVLNNYNKSGNDGRTNFYGIYGGTPRIVINGNIISANTNYSQASIFDNYKTNTTPFEMKSQIGITNDSFISYTKIYKKSESPLSTGSLAVFATEDSLAYNAPNGERLHHNVFRSAFYNNSINLPAAIGDSVILRHAIKRDLLLKENYVNAIAILQNNKEVLQASKSRMSAPSQTNSKYFTKLQPISVYPNPSKGSFNISSTLIDGDIQIFNMNGKLVLQEKTQGKVNINNLQNGLYTFVLKTNSGLYSGKLSVVN